LFIASAGASSAHLTVSETFPVEICAETIAVFFALALVLGAVGPILSGALLARKQAARAFIGGSLTTDRQPAPNRGCWPWRGITGRPRIDRIGRHEITRPGVRLMA